MEPMGNKLANVVASCAPTASGSIGPVRACGCLALILALIQLQPAINQVEGATGTGLAAAYANSAAAGANSAAAGAQSQVGPGHSRQLAKLRAQKAQRELEGVRRQLVELEREGAGESLAECAKWDKLNTFYAQLLGQRQRARPSELAKRRQCDALRQLTAEAQRKLNQLRESLANGHLDATSRLLDVYLDLRASLDTNAPLARGLEHLLASSEQARAGLEQLDQFIESVGEKLASSQPVAGAEDEPSGDEIGELDAALRRLVDREHELEDSELDELAKLGRQLEQVLASGQLDLGSGRFRYLSGTVDAVRAVLLHKLESDDAEQAGAETPPASAQVYAQAAGSGDDDEPAETVEPEEEPEEAPEVGPGAGLVPRLPEGVPGWLQARISNEANRALGRALPGAAPAPAERDTPTSRPVAAATS